jgi:membrane protease YdiL (CAAX protease family)
VIDRFAARSGSLDLALGAVAWCAGFLWVGRGGSWLPLAMLALATAARLLAIDPATRALLRPGARPLAIGLLAGALQVAATSLLYGPAARLAPALRDATRHLYAVLGGVGLGSVGTAALVAAVVVAEETVWRGAALARGGWARLVGLSALYAACHAPSGSPLLVAIAFLCDLFWGSVRRAAGSTFAGVIAHLLWDAAILGAWPL